MTLDICGDKQIQSPTESDIRQAVFALDTKNEDAFLILGSTEMTYIQTGGDQKAGFLLEYQDTTPSITTAPSARSPQTRS